MDLYKQGKRFWIERARTEGVMVRFYVDKVFNIQYNGTNNNFMGLMYGLAYAMHQKHPAKENTYPFMDEYEKNKVILPDNDDMLNKYLDLVKWHFRIWVGDSQEKFTMEFRVDENTLRRRATYDTQNKPSPEMREIFKVLSGVDLYEIVELKFSDPPREDRIKDFKPRFMEKRG